MSYYVLVQQPRQEAFYVRCRALDECLRVVDEEISESPRGTRVTMFDKDPRQHAELIAMWLVEEGGPKRYRVNGRPR